MAIEFSLKINKNMLDEKFLLTEIKTTSAFSGGLGESLTSIFEDLYNNLGFGLSLLEMKDSYYSKVETIFLDGDFEYEQYLYFQFDKFADLTKSYETAIKIILDLMCKITTSALPLWRNLKHCLLRRYGINCVLTLEFPQGAAGLRL